MAVPLTLTPSTVNYTTNLYNLPPNAMSCLYMSLPAPWAPVSNDPGIQFSITNNAVDTPITPVLLDVWTNPVTSATQAYTFVELTTIMPGDTLNEFVAGLPVTNMRLAIWNLMIGSTDINGFSVSAQAWAV